MAAQFVFPFLSLFFYFLLLLSAAVEDGKDRTEECEVIPRQCGYVGEISFPFTTVNDPKCGFYVRGCDNETAEKEIELVENQFYKIDSIQKQDNQIFIYGNSTDESEIDSVPHDISNHISLDKISFHGCSHNSTCENMWKYRNCPDHDYDIYFTSEPDHRPMFPIFPIPCSPPVQFPEGLAASDPPDHCRLLFSILQIRVELDRYCEYCHEGNPCLLKHDHFTCVPKHPCPPPLPPPSPPPSYYDDAKDRQHKHLQVVILGLSIVLVTVITIALLVIILVLYNRRIKSSGVENQSRSTFRALTRNTTIPESGAVYFGIPVFSYEELQEATNNFDQARELGEGGFGTVYYGKLQDGREVAVKRLFERNYRPVEQFTNEIQILTRMRHINLVSLYGCTSRHSRELLLVYEYVPNGTVSCHLHGDKTKKHGSLPWHVRMKIAIETASALTYLHASDIIHRDVKSSNILLDNNFCVKVADFGLSRLFPNDVTHVSTAPKGTPGYVDPDYRLCYQLTSKSDVYSFGVVLVELISSLPAVDMTRERDDIQLANLARRKIQRREFCELVDPSLGFQSDDGLKRMIISVAELAFHCLQGDKELRPSMGEVLEVLQRIGNWKDEPAGNIDLESINVNGARVAQSYVHPSLPNTWMELQRHHQTL